ncbi:MAG TPA: hypothetical protein VGM32_12715 [Rhodopila sp.]|jgi:hypothetical protein
MTPDDPLLVHTSAFGGKPAFVVACDQKTLLWLAQSFRDLGNRKSFTIGDGLPVGSDRQCAIEVMPGSTRDRATIAPLAARTFRWIVLARQARRYVALLGGMAACASPCHQYLEADSPDVPVVMVTKGEYDLRALRTMRDRRPASPLAAVAAHGPKVGASAPGAP